jgi:hypothetical protein
MILLKGGTLPNLVVDTWQTKKWTRYMAHPNY